MLWDALPSALDLARFQFAFTVTFHFLFPAFTIGLASYLAVLEGLWLWTGREAYLDVFRYWLKVFAVAFAMGVVSGLVMSYQFGTNWSVFADRTGPVLGPVMAYEVLTAFFLEAGFLGAVAPLGTAVTEDQLALLPPVGDDVIQAGYADFAERWNPILDVFDESATGCTSRPPAWSRSAR